MPISDEVIELAPVAKTKKKLLIMFIAVGLSVAMAIAFLVLYLLKPNVESNAAIVNDVIHVSDDLFEYSEDGVTLKKYASIGNTYSIRARVSYGENAGPDIVWSCSDEDAVSQVKLTDEELAALEEGVFEYRFIPQDGFHGREVVIKARSASDATKYLDVKVNIVSQGAEYMEMVEYRPINDNFNVTPVTDDYIAVPYYASTASSNKAYVVLFDQYGTRNESTQTNALLTTINKKGTKIPTNSFTAKSDNEGVVRVGETFAGTGREVTYPDGRKGPQHSYFTFTAVGEGRAVITVTANVENDNCENKITHRITIEVKGNDALGFAEKIYFYNKAVIDEAFIAKVIDANGKLDRTKLQAEVKKVSGLVENPASITMPYFTTYEDISKHILVDPISIQYDFSKKKMKEDWFDQISVVSSNTKVLTVDKGHELIAKGNLLSGDPKRGGNECKLTFTDNKEGGIKASQSVNVTVVANNTGGKTSVKVGSKVTDNPGETAVSVAPNSTATVSIIYDLAMPGKILEEQDVNILECGYVSKQFSVTYDASVIEVSIEGIEKPLVPDTVYSFANSSMTFKKAVEGGTATSGKTNFLGTAVFNIKFKDTGTGEYSFVFKKYGTSMSGNNDWTGVDSGDKEWFRTVTFGSVQRASLVSLVESVSDDDTDFHTNVLKYESRGNTASLYLQYQYGKTLDKIIDWKSLVVADAGSIEVSFTFSNIAPAYIGSGNNFIREPANIDPSSPMAVCRLNATDFEGKSVGETLLITVYPCDAITGFSAIPSSNVTLTYSKTEKGSVIIPKDSVTVTHKYKTAAVRYVPGTPDLYYGDTADAERLLDPTETGDTVTYSHEGKALYRYYIKDFKLETESDIYEYSYLKKIDFSKITLVYHVKEGDFHSGSSPETAPVGTYRATFYREADGFAIYAGGENDRINTYPADKRIKNSNTGEGQDEYDYSGKYEHSANQDEIVVMYISSTVKLSDGTELVVELPEVGNPAAVVKARLQFPKTWASGTTSTIIAKNPTDAADNNLYAIRFRVPKVTSEDGTKQLYSFPISVYANELAFTAQNLARPVKSIGIYSSAGCAESDKIASTDILHFGDYLNEQITSGKIYIKAEYDVPDSKYWYFESVRLTLPEGITVSGNGISGDNGSYTLTPFDDGLKAGETPSADIPEFECTLTLNDKAIKMNGELTVERSAVVAGFVAPTCKVEIGTGIASMTVDGKPLSAGGTMTLNETVVLADNRTNDTVTYALIFEERSKNAHPGIKYDMAHMQVTKPDDGVLISYVTITGDAPKIEITVDLSKLTTLSAEPLTFTFKDTANGANTVFTVNVNFTLEVDIYALTFGGSEGNYVANTTGLASPSTQDMTVEVVYNGGTSAVQPTSELIAAADVASIVTKEGDEYIPYSGDVMSVVKDGGTYTLKVNNTLNRLDKEYYVKLAYKQLAPVYRRVLVGSLSHHLELDADNNSVEVTGGEGTRSAKVLVDGATKTARLAALVINDGTDEAVSGKTVTYKVYTAADKKTEATDVTVSTDGVLTFAPEQAVNTVYYSASYNDAGGSGAIYTIDVAITYAVKVTSVSLENIDENTLSDRTITLYYLDATHYAGLSLGGKIKTLNSAGKTFADFTPAYSIELVDPADGASLDVSGTTLTPRAVNAGVGIIVKAAFGTEGDALYSYVESERYTVKIVAIAPVTLASSAGTIDIISNNTVSVTPEYATYPGFSAGLTFDYADKGNPQELTVDPLNGTYTVGINTRISGLLKDYAFTAKVVYTKDAETSLTVVGGDLTVETGYTLTVDKGNYTPSFTIKAGNATVPTYTEGGPMHTIVPGAAYTITVDSTAHGHNGASYTAVADGVIAGVGTFPSGTSGITATATLAQNAGGKFTVTVTAVVYGTEYTASQTYMFTFGTDATVGFEYMIPGGSYTSVGSLGTMAIDFTDAPYKFKYSINNIDIANAEDINIHVNGDSSAFASEPTLVKDAAGKCCYVEVSVIKPTKLFFGGSFKLGGTRMVYTENKSITLTATEPSFELSSHQTSNDDRDWVLPGNTLNFVLVNKATDFKGTFTTTYTIISGSSAAEINATSGVLTAKNIVVYQMVIVRATVVISNGVYAGTYTIDKEITVYGLKLPEISFDEKGPLTIVAGGSKSFSLDSGFALKNDIGYGAGSDKHTYSVDIDMSASSDLASADYTLTKNGPGDYTLSVKKSDLTAAGGLVTLTLTGTVTSAAHRGETVTATLDVIVIPSAKATVPGVTVSNGIGSYDIAAAVRPCFTAAEGNFIAETDTYRVVAFEFDNSADQALASLSGSVLTLKQNITAAKTFDLRATLVMTSGKYSGAEITGTASVAVDLPTSNAVTLDWVSADNKYASVDASELYTLPASSFAISKVDITGIGAGGGVLAVTDNGTDHPSISVDRTANMFMSGAATSNKSVNVAYTVTRADGSVLYGTTALTVKPVVISVACTIDGSEMTSTTFETAPNVSFSLALTADNGFTPVITGISEKTGTTESSDLTKTFGSNSALFTVGDLTVERTLTVAVSTEIGSLEYTYTFTVSVKISGSSEGIYSASSLTNVEIAKGSSTSVTSDWTATGSSFNYPTTLNFTAPVGKTLTDLFESITLKTSKGNYAVDLRTGNVDFPKESDGWGDKRAKLTSFTVEMVIKTGAAFDRCTVSAKLTAYSRERGGSRESVTQRYALRVIGNVTVTLDKNTDDTVTGLETTSSSIQYKNAYAGLPEPKRTGYNFLGWFLNSAGTGDSIANGNTVTNTENHTLYAKWEAMLFGIMFDENLPAGSALKGTKPADKTGVPYGSTYSGLADVETDGYDFEGWYSERSGGSKVQNGERVLLVPASGTEITLYAHWTAKTFTVTFDANGGTLPADSASSVEVVYNGVFGNMPVPTKLGYTFKEWRNGTTKVTKDTVIKLTADVTLTAVWEEKSYDITLVLNGGALKNATFKATVSATGGYSIPADDEITRDGYTFKGWHTAEKGGSKLAKGAAFDPALGKEPYTILYAVWQANGITVTLDLNGGKVEGFTGNPEFAEITGDDFSAHRYIHPVRAGYRFLGWKKDGAGDFVTEKITIGSANIILIAQWLEVWNVTFELDGGNLDGLALVQTVDNGTEITLGAPLRTGYTFAGWTVNGGSDKKNSGDKVTITEATSIVATWTATTFTVTFDLNGGYTGGDPENTAAVSIEGVAYGTEILDLSAPAPETATRKFSHWEIDGVRVDGNTAVTSAVTVTAVYGEYKSATVTLDANGGTIAGATSLVFGSKVNDTFTAHKALTPAREGFIFGGWKKGDDTVTTTDVTVDATAITLTAVWNVVVTFDANGGTLGGEATLEVAYGTKLDSVTTAAPTRVNCVFAGWTKADGSAITEADVVTSDVTLKASWNAVVTFDANGGTLTGEATATVAYGTKLGTVTTSDPTRGGYEFSGWMKEDGSAITEADVVTAAVTVKAAWIQLYTVSFAVKADGWEGPADGEVTAPASKTYKAGEKYGALADPVYTGSEYTFVGWYKTDELTGEQVTADTEFDTSVGTLYAKWNKVVPPDPETTPDEPVAL